MKEKVIECPHYKGTGYGYGFDSIKFYYCKYCNEKILKLMISQRELEAQT